MNTLTRTTIVFAMLGFIAVGSIPGQTSLDENAREALAAQREAEIAQKQAEAAQKQMETVQRKMEDVRMQAEVERTQALVTALDAEQSVSVAAPVVPPTPPSISWNRAWPSRAGGAASVLVIPSAEIKAEDAVAIAEDMNIMSRIFVRNLEEARIATARGGFFASSRDPLVALLGGGSSIESMYLQGSGALFLMKADFPLSPPPQVEEEKQTEQKTESDPVWEEMRRDIYEPQEAARDSRKAPEEKYDAEKVENLKTTLIKALKHAANIRALKSDESVIITVTGGGRSSAARAVRVSSPRRTSSSSQRSEVIVEEKDRAGTAPAKIVAGPSSGQTTYSSPTVLVIRAKKADIDQFAKGALDADQFRQHVQVLTCAYLSAEGGRADAFNPYYHLQQEVRY